jgi:hypothetical protein
MIKVTLYLPSGRYVSLYAKRRQYKILNEMAGAREYSIWEKIKIFFKKIGKKLYHRSKRG